MPILLLLHIAASQWWCWWMCSYSARLIAKQPCPFLSLHMWDSILMCVEHTDMWMHIVSICCTSMKFHCQKRCYTVPLIVEYLLYTQQYTVQQLNEKDSIIEMYEKCWTWGMWWKARNRGNVKNTKLWNYSVVNNFIKQMKLLNQSISAQNQVDRSQQNQNSNNEYRWQ